MPGSHTDSGPPRSRLRIGIGAGIVLVLVALVAAIVLSALTPRGQTDIFPVSVGASHTGSAAFATSGATGAASGQGSAVAILVHVLGAVKNPGLYQLHEGDRVVDAVAIAGGFIDTADQAQQNLARVVTDGEQVVIPQQGETVSGVQPGGLASGGAQGGGRLVNINTADASLLETLPQVGPQMAQRIIAWRTENGRFSQVDDLRNVSGIGEKTFEALKPLVTV